ncbi:MAG: hypothetical protein IJ605_04810 [Prevotella sp.]|nr:hypothetical protein [Prevotella sp.]
MEENKNLTAERSLEIIREQIEQSRRTVSKSTGQALYVSGLCTIAMAGVVAIVNYVSQTALGHLLWLAMPLVIWIAMRNIFKKRQHEPESLVGSLVGKTWWTFAFFALGFFVIAIIWGFIGGRLLSPSEYVLINIKIAPTIVLLMGMAVTMTGHILKQRWLVIFGIAAGLLCFMWEHFGIGNHLLSYLTVLSPEKWAVPFATLPCLTIVLFAFIGLVLPGMMLKKQSL